jgi:hypothetical protein
MSMPCHDPVACAGAVVSNDDERNTHAATEREFEVAKKAVEDRK